MRVRSHHLAVSLFAGAIFLSGLAWFSVRVPTVQAACGTNSSVTITNPTTSGGAIGGMPQLTAYVGSTTAPTSVTFEMTAPTTIILGDVTAPLSGSPYSWVLNWDSKTVSNGSYKLLAIAHYGANTTADCPSSPLSINILNPVTVTTLSVAVLPNTWQALPGQQGSFTASGTYTDQNGIKYPVGTTSTGATFIWDTNAGTVAPNNGPGTILTTGPQTGSYTLGVTVTMNGLNQHALAAISIVKPVTTTSAAPSPTPLPSPGLTPATSASPSPQPIAGIAGTAPLTAAQAAVLTTTPTIFRPPTDTNAAPILPAPILGCLREKIGSNYSAISSGTLQPTSTDRLNGLVCFSGANRIPSILAPIAPAHIAEVPRTTDLVTMGKIVNQTTTNQKGDKITALLLNGTAAPNSSVYLYFFSDPMVLRAETDAHGKWSYVLQNPLKPGKHEVYAVAAKDSTNFVRTSAIPISVAAAADGNTNGSLVIESRWQAAQVGYVGVAVLMVIAALLLLVRLARRTKVITGTLPELVMPEIPGQP